MLIDIDFRWLKQGIKNRNSPHLPTQGYIEYPPPPGYTKRYVYASHADVLSGSLRVPTPRGVGTRDETVGGYNSFNYNPNQV